MAKKTMLSTDQTLEALASRGYTVPYTTLIRWLNAGKFLGAERDNSHPRGAVWRIPEASIKKFEPPKKGRPATPKDGKK